MPTFYEKMKSRIKRKIGKKISKLLKKPYYFDVSNLYADRRIKVYQDGSNAILQELEFGKPCAIARMGSTETRTLWEFKNSYSSETLQEMRVNSGFFPTTKENLDRFNEEFIKVLSNIDVMGVWQFEFKDEENALISYAKKAKLVHLDCILPIFYEIPWTKYLKGKKVLVIHPFETSIQGQYKKRELLFDNSDILPEFELKTIKAVQSAADNSSEIPFKNWFEALEHMKSEISKTDFDVAIIGAGAYGIFLAEYCKQMGKQAIHMGGTIQILFGIKGSRWLNYNDNYKKLMDNENWTWALDEEKPRNFQNMEGGNGPYWR